jgi:hypothetical protein
MQNLFKSFSALSMLIAAVALLIFAVKYSPVQASGNNTLNSGGKIMMDQSTFVYNNQ